jgi:histone deacetylase complex regulatory component SIN3
MSLIDLFHADARHVYSSFLDILRMYREREKSLDEVIREVRVPLFMSCHVITITIEIP